MRTSELVVCLGVGLFAAACSHDGPPPNTPTSAAETTTDPSGASTGPSSDGYPSTNSPGSPDPAVNRPDSSEVPPRGEGVQ
ncbi:MAG TPA: hypothetical protein VEQ59_15880 [Polyangiaceae bacterium]|nr:hypothetical protein [Polyangiaceae bacterium]